MRLSGDGSVGVGGYSGHIVPVGRNVEAATLKAAMAGVGSGHGAVLIVHGEAGIGKTTLVEHAVNSALDEDLPSALILRVTGTESETELSFAALHRLLLPLIPLMTALPKPRHLALATIFGLEHGEQPSPLLVGLATLALLAESARERPVLCVVDDAQWLDRASVAVLAFVARRLAAERVGMFFCVRDLLTDDATFDGLPDLRLSGLAAADALHVLAQRAGGTVDPHVARRITAAVGGNPLALNEFARRSSPEELSGDRLMSRPPPLHGRIEAHYRRRVRALPPVARTVLLVASAESSGDPALLWRAAATLGISDDELTDAESDLAEFVALRPRVAFRHAFVRSAVEAVSSAQGRRQVHAVLADIVDKAADPDRWSWHLAAGAGRPDEEIAVQLERAAGRARARCGYPAEATFLGRAAELTPQPHARGVRLVAAAEAALRASDYRRCLALVTEAEPLLAGDEWRVRADRLRAMTLAPLGHTADAPAALVASARDLEGVDATLARDTWTYALAAGWLSLSRAHGTTLRDVAAAALAAPSTPDEASATCVDRLWTGIATRVAIGYTEAVPVLRRAIAELDAAGRDRIDLVFHPLLVLFAAHDLWDPDSGRRWLEGMAERERGRGALMSLWHCLRALAYFERSAGRMAAARAYAREARSVSPNIRPGRVVSFPGEEADALDDDAATAVARLAETAAHGTLGASATACRLLLAVHRIAEGNYPEARDHARVVYDQDAPVFGNQVLPELVEAAVRAGDRDLAAAALRRLTGRALASGSDWARGLLSRSQALLATDAAAEAHYRNAVTLLERARMPLDHARARLLYGEWLRRAKRRSDAVAQLRSAHEMFTSMGAKGFAERTCIELRAVGVRGPAAARRGLTAQEDQVARLAARGMTNREIATSLFISESTAAYHLKKVFRKLDVSSRRDLARRGLDDDVSHRRSG